MDHFSFFFIFTYTIGIVINESEPSKASFFIYFWSFQSNNTTIIQQINVKNVSGAFSGFKFATA